MFTILRGRAVLTCAIAVTVGAALMTSAAGCGSAPPPRPAAARPTAARPAAARSAVSTPRPSASRGTAAAGCPPAPYGMHLYAPGSSKTVALTFDDGPGRSTAAILAILARYRVPATFFNIGAAMATRPGLVREEVTEGYAMGNHTWNHLSLVTLTAARQAAELSQASAEQQAIAGTVPCAFRPPYGYYDATTLELAQQRRMTAWLWSTDTLDWMANGSGAASWVHRIVQMGEQGGALQHPILLMHDQRAGNPATVAALPTIIQFFLARGYRFVAL